MNSRVTQFVVSEVLYNGHLQSLGAASIVYVATVLLGSPVSLSMLLVPYVLFQAVYWHDRYRHLAQDRLTNQERTRHVQQYSHAIPFLIAALILIVLLLLFFNSTLWSMLLAIVLLCFGFAYPTHFKQVTKQIPLFKNFYVATVFGLLVLLPPIYYGQPLVFSPTVVALLSFVIAESLITQIILDIKDRPGDQKLKLRTLPVLIGKQNTIRTIVFFSLVVFSLTFLYGQIRGTNLLVALAIGTVLLNLYTLYSINRGDKNAFIVAAAKYVLWPAILIVAQYD